MSSLIVARFLIVATLACLAAAAVYYSILAAYTPNIVVVPVIKLLSATAATASAVTAASAGAALLLVVGALLLAYLAAQGISRLLNPRYRSSQAVTISSPWYTPFESIFASRWHDANTNHSVNSMTRNADGRNNYHTSIYRQPTNYSRDHLGRANYSNTAQTRDYHITRDSNGGPSLFFSSNNSRVDPSPSNRLHKGAYSSSLN
jgi:Tfp pilus assembly major pilin PilA